MVTIEDYEPLVGSETIDRIRRKAQPLLNKHVVNISSTYYGGGVAAKLSSLALLMNQIGIKTGWRIIQGTPDFFAVTKSMHNALQGGDITLTDQMKQIYEQVNYENSIRNHLRHDIVIVHDPQPLSLIQHYPHTNPWIWRCHIDLTNPHRELFEYLKPWINSYDAAVVSIPEYRQDITPPQFFFMPATDPFSMLNREMSEDEIAELMRKYHIPTDLPLVVQVSRFDRWKDPQGVIDAFRLATKETPATLVLLGSAATDDPEGEGVYRSLIAQQGERILIINQDDSLLVNALQRKAAVVLQKSLREGFGLTVTEAMWKGTPVIGGNVGGIRYQINDGSNGFLVDSVEQAGERIAQLLKDGKLREQLGREAKETVRRNFLMTRLMEQYIDLFNSFEIVIRLKEKRYREFVPEAVGAGKT
jgi:trehalose synthase